MKNIAVSSRTTLVIYFIAFLIFLGSDITALLTGSLEKAEVAGTFFRISIGIAAGFALFQVSEKIPKAISETKNDSIRNFKNIEALINGVTHSNITLKFSNFSVFRSHLNFNLEHELDKAGDVLVLRWVNPLPYPREDKDIMRCIQRSCNKSKTVKLHYFARAGSEISDEQDFLQRNAALIFSDLSISKGPNKRFIDDVDVYVSRSSIRHSTYSFICFERQVYLIINDDADIVSENREEHFQKRQYVFIRDKEIARRINMAYDKRSQGAGTTKLEKSTLEQYGMPGIGSKKKAKG